MVKAFAADAKFISKPLTFFSVNQRPIEVIVLGDGPEVTLVIAGIHGDEDAGVPLIYDVIDFLKNHPQWLSERKFVFMPNVNPDGVARRSRTNVHGVDLNRNFPAKNWRAQGINRRPLSEPESQAIYSVIQRFRPIRLISIHQMRRGGLLDYDGPGKDLAAAMSKHCDLGIERLGGRPGSLGSYFGLTLELPVITVEIPRRISATQRELVWNKYGAMLLAGIVFPEEFIMPKESLNLPEPHLPIP